MFISNGISYLMHCLAKPCFALFVWMYLYINVVNISIYKKMVSFANILVISCAHIYNKILIPIIAAYLLH